MSTESTVTLPVLCLPQFVLFPGTYATLHVGDPTALRVIEVAAQHHRGYLCLAMIDPTGDRQGLPAHHEPMHVVGCLTEVRDRVQTPHGLQVKLGGLDRLGIILDLDTTAGRYVRAVYRDSGAHEAAPRSDPDLAHALLELPGFPSFVLEAAETTPWPLWLDAVAFHLPAVAEEKQFLLALDDVDARAMRVLELARVLKGAMRAAAPERLN